MRPGHKNKLLILLVLVMLFTLIPTSFTFASAPSQWAVEEIEQAKVNQLTTNRVLSNYQQNITREEFSELAVKLFEALSGSPATPVTSNPFQDTDNPEILKAYKLGIVNGVAPGKFGPNQQITRQEISVMLLRTLQAEDGSIDTKVGSSITFADESEIAAWALESVKFLNQQGIMQGVGSNKIGPKGNTTREQAILLVQRTFDRFYFRRRFKVLTIGQAAAPTSLDPQRANDVPSSRIMAQIYETLIIQNNKMELEPGLAQSWRQINDTTYEFKLRKGVKFHNGETLTAKDVAYTLRRAYNSPYVGFIVQQLDPDKIKVIDDYTIQIGTTTPYAPILDILAHVGTSIVNEKAVISAGDNYDFKPVGTGPYRLGDKDFINVSLIAFDNYHGIMPKLDRVVFKEIPLAYVRTWELERKTVDIALDLLGTEAAELANSKDLVTYRSPNLTTTYIGFNVNKKPFDDVRVRQAINYALDLENIVSAVFRDTASVAKGPMGPNVWAASPSQKPYHYNIEKAKALLKEAGYEKGFNTTILVNDNQSRIDIAEILEYQLRKVNITTKVMVTDWANYLDLTGQGDFDMFVLGWTTVTGEADYALYSQFHSTQHGYLGNRTNYSNKRVDELLDLARKTTDPAKRRAYYVEVQEIIYQEAPWVFFSHGENIAMTRRDTTGFQLHPSGNHRLWTVNKK